MATVNTQPCGTYAAYRRHRKAGETPCDPCSEAARAAWRRKGLNDTCSRCGGPVCRRPWNAEQIVCHPCRRIESCGIPPVPCTRCGKPMETTPRSAPSERRMCGACRRPKKKPCAVCGKPFRSPHGKPSQPTCSWECGVILRLGDPVERAVAQDGPTCQVSYSDCTECGRLFTRRRGNQVTCGDKECRRRYQNRQSSEWMMRRYREDPIFRDKMIAAAENRRADRLGAGNIRSPKALVTFLRARDNGTCGICGGQVTDTTGPMRPSIDHKIPLRPDAGPPGEHTLANVQLAHYRCNLRKGNRVSRELHFPAACELVVRAPRPRRTARNLARPGEP